MAAPGILQELQHGKLLTSKNFPLFVESWNFISKRCANMIGDADTASNLGSITVDNADPEHPIIRYVGKQSEEKQLEVADNLVVVANVEYTGESNAVPYAIKITYGKLYINSEGKLDININEGETPPTYIETTPLSNPTAVPY